MLYFFEFKVILSLNSLISFQVWNLHIIINMSQKIQQHDCFSVTVLALLPYFHILYSRTQISLWLMAWEGLQERAILQVKGQGHLGKKKKTKRSIEEYSLVILIFVYDKRRILVEWNCHWYKHSSVSLKWR